MSFAKHARGILENVPYARQKLLRETPSECNKKTLKPFLTPRPFSRPLKFYKDKAL